MEIKKARRKSFDVDYVEVTDENMVEVAAWCGGRVVAANGEVAAHIHVSDKNTMNSRQKKAYVGDLVLRQGTSFKSFTQKSFKRSFDPTES
jgi:hypothetical protein